MRSLLANAELFDNRIVSDRIDERKKLKNLDKVRRPGSLFGWLALATRNSSASTSCRTED